MKASFKPLREYAKKYGIAIHTNEVSVTITEDEFDDVFLWDSGCIIL